MKKHSFLAGMLTMALIVGLGMSALAATGTVSFNASALKLNGQQISAAGENYTLANGQSVPASITYTDEKGGGTTYLPVRRISELMGIEVGWDGAVTLTGDVKTPEPTTPPTNYSDWSKEDEAAYQEFKGLWEVELKLSKEYMGRDCDFYLAYLKSPYTIDNVKKYYASTRLKETERFLTRMMSELMSKNDVILLLSSTNREIPEDPRDTGNDVGDYLLLVNGSTGFSHWISN